MLEHHAKLFYFSTHRLCRLMAHVELAIEERGGDSLPDEDEGIITKGLLKRIEVEAENLKFDRVSERLSAFYTDDKLLQPLGGPPFTLQHLLFQLKELHKDIYVSLSPGNNKFVVIRGSDLEYYDNPKLFGVEVAERFPQANVEITAAGNCYATGNYTACVFHLMRAVEYGARKMVMALNVRKELQHPVELSEWGDLVKALDKGVAALNVGTRKHMSKKVTFEFYNHAVAQFRNFKDAWRNNVSHTRKTYQAGQTKDIMDNTRQFMQHLASRLKE